MLKSNSLPYPLKVCLFLLLTLVIFSMRSMMYFITHVYKTPLEVIPQMKRLPQPLSPHHDKEHARILGPSDCYRVSGVEYGAEDIQIIKEKNVAIISSGFRPHFPSNLFLLSLDQLPTSAKVEPLEFDEDFDKSTFHPHGIYVWKTNTGEYHVYVVNHHNDFECVDVFSIDFANKKAYHIKRIKDPVFLNLNDLVLVDDLVFYATNWKMDRKEGFSMLKRGNVIFYDGNSGIVVQKDLLMPNGIDISNDKSVVFVGLSMAIAIAKYSRNPDNTLNFIHQYPAGGLVDNVYFVTTNNSSAELWYAGQNFAKKFYVESNFDLSGPEDVFISRGSFIKMVSSVYPYDTFVIIGTVDSHLIICET